MTSDTIGKKAPAGVGFGQNSPAGWAPVEIIYRKLRVQWVMEPDNKLHMHAYYVKQLNVIIPQPYDIDAYCLQLAQHPHNLREKSKSTPVPTLVSNPWDIDVFHPCYIVLQLDWTIDWYFSTNKYAVIPDDPTIDYTNQYFALTHYKSDGSKLPGQPQPGDECQIIRFGVADPGTRDGWADKLDFNITSGGMPVSYDPDIKNNGGPPPVLLSNFSNSVPLL